jgi:hypothetical protein
MNACTSAFSSAFELEVHLQAHLDSPSVVSRPQQPHHAVIRHPNGLLKNEQEQEEEENEKKQKEEGEQRLCVLFLPWPVYIVGGLPIDEIPVAFPRCVGDYLPLFSCGTDASWRLLRTDTPSIRFHLSGEYIFCIIEQL